MNRGLGSAMPFQVATKFHVLSIAVTACACVQHTGLCP